MSADSLHHFDMTEGVLHAVSLLAPDGTPITNFTVKDVSAHGERLLVETPETAVLPPGLVAGESHVYLVDPVLRTWRSPRLDDVRLSLPYNRESDRGFWLSPSGRSILFMAPGFSSVLTEMPPQIYLWDEDAASVRRVVSGEDFRQLMDRPTVALYDPHRDLTYIESSSRQFIPRSSDGSRPKGVVRFESGYDVRPEMEIRVQPLDPRIVVDRQSEFIAYALANGTADPLPFAMDFGPFTGMRVESVSSSWGSCLAEGNLVRCSGLRTTTEPWAWVMVRATPLVAGTSILPVAVVPVARETNTGNNVISMEIQRLPAADLRLTAATRSPTVPLGSSLLIDFAITNASGVTVTGVELRASLENTAVISRAEIRVGGGTCTVTFEDVLCRIPSVAAGATAAGLITVVPSDVGSYPMQLTVSSTDFGDAQLRNESAVVSGVVVLPPPPEDDGAGDGGGGPLEPWMLVPSLLLGLRRATRSSRPTRRLAQGPRA